MLLQLMCVCISLTSLLLLSVCVCVCVCEEEEDDGSLMNVSPRAASSAAGASPMNVSPHGSPPPAPILMPCTFLMTHANTCVYRNPSLHEFLSMRSDSGRPPRCCSSCRPRSSSTVKTSDSKCSCQLGTCIYEFTPLRYARSIVVFLLLGVRVQPHAHPSYFFCHLSPIDHTLTRRRHEIFHDVECNPP